MHSDESLLAPIGWSDFFSHGLPANREAARVVSVYSARVEIWTAWGPVLATLRKRVMTEKAPLGGVAVGDWVAVVRSGQEAVVEEVLQRKNVLVRRASGDRPLPQAVVANVDLVAVVISLDSAVDRPLVERYVDAIRSSGAAPRLVFTKADVVAEAATVHRELTDLAPALVTSARDGTGIKALSDLACSRTTTALVGSSGAGKSALINCLLGRDEQREGAVRPTDKQGRHTTTRRTMFLLPTGGLLIDTPGMRDFRPWTSANEA